MSQALYALGPHPADVIDAVLHHGQSLQTHSESDRRQPVRVVPKRLEEIGPINCHSLKPSPTHSTSA